MGNNTNRFLANLGLLLFGFASACSGMLIQIKYHIGNHGDIKTNDLVLGLNYHNWSAVHKFSILALSLFMFKHLLQHWKWYKAVMNKRLFAKNQQVLFLSILFLLVSTTGLLPWLIDLLKGDQIIRKAFIEVHDKLSILLTFYLILHIFKRMRWFFVY